MYDLGVGGGYEGRLGKWINEFELCIRVGVANKEWLQEGGIRVGLANAWCNRDMWWTLNVGAVKTKSCKKIEICRKIDVCYKLP